MKTEMCAGIGRGGRKGVVLPALAVLLLGVACLEAAEFIRGDANGDGSVSIADAHLSLKYQFRGQATLACRDSADVDDNGNLELTDPIWLLNYLFYNGTAPISPFPGAGSDPAGSSLGCGSYGGGSSLVDPKAELKVLDSSVEGGKAGSGRITVTYSSSTPLGGLSGAIDDESDILFSPRTNVKVVGEGSFSAAEYRLGRVSDGKVTFATIMNIDDEPPFSSPAGEGLVVFSIPVCVKSGTPAGRYSFTLRAGELIDDASSRAITPALVGGTITVLSDVTESECAVDPPAPIPVDVRFMLRDAAGTSGGAVKVPFLIRSSEDAQAYAFSIDFDETVLEASEVEHVWRRPSGKDYDFFKTKIDNRNINPGSGGVDEGFVAGAAVLSLEPPAEVIPRDEDVELLDLNFRVKPEAQTTATELRFMERVTFQDGRYINTLTAGGKTATVELANSFVFVNGRINIIPDGIPFVRGDSNDDGAVGVSDAVFALDHLFLAGTAPRCADAADTNDDGQLDLSDPVVTLQFLFLGGNRPPEPYPAAGPDTTPDTLGCPAR